MKNLIIIILSGILLIPILLGAIIVKKVRLYFWNYFNYSNFILPLDKMDQIFEICVNYLMIVGEKTNMTYTKVNVYIFCFIWPIITLIALIL